MGEVISEEMREQLLRTCRTTIGEEFRSLTYFTPDEYEHIYLREDLERGEDPLVFVENERQGFTSQRTYEWSELGSYRYTIRSFENGNLVRVIVGKHGAYMTTDPLSMDRFDELSEAVTAVLEEIEARS